MKLNEKIRALREMKHWSQEEMAERMQMSKNGYSKIERGETRPSLRRLEQMATIFNIDMTELVDTRSPGMVFIVGDNSDNKLNYCGTTAAVAAENDKLKMMLAYKDEIIAQQRSEIETLKTLVAVLKPQHDSSR